MIQTIMNEWTNELTNERTNEQTNDRTNERTNQPSNQATRKWQLAMKTYYPLGLNTVPSPMDGGVTPFVITYSATAAEAAKLDFPQYT